MADAQIVTFGCRLNIQESERIRGLTAGMADLVVVNSCAVTGEAVRQAGQSIRKLRRQRPGSRIVATGCAAQVDPARFAAMDGVTHVVGNAEKLRPETWAELGPLSARILSSDIMATSEMPATGPDRFPGRVRGFVQVQNGCDHRCTFCVIPFGRGRSRSLPPAEVVAEVRRLVDAGHKEIVFTGVDVTSYGQDHADGLALGGLVRRVLHEIPNLARLRLSSIDSIEVDADLLRALAEEDRLMPHLHLSLQSGDDLILKRMKRRHTSADAVAFCDAARRLRPDIVFGADIIAGFPTETEAMFGRSVGLVAQCGIMHLHAFPYSSRPGTPAARMPQTPASVIKERAARLRAEGERAFDAFLEAQIGQARHALVEHGGLARTEHFAPVRLSTPLAPGSLVPIRITGRAGLELMGDTGGPAEPVAVSAQSAD